MALQPVIGKKAPDFELPEAYGGTVRLSSILQSRTALIAFYPSDWGVMCTVEMKELKDLYDRFESAGAEVLVISTNSTFCHSAWRFHLDLPFFMLSDFDGKVSDSYGVLVGEEGYMLGRSKRSVFIVDRAGILRHSWVTENPAVEPDYAELIKVCQALGKERFPNPSRAPADRTPGSSIS